MKGRWKKSALVWVCAGVAIALGSFLVPTPAHAYCELGDIHGVESRRLLWSTPLVYVWVPSAIANLTAAAVTATHYSGDYANAGTSIFAATTAVLNGFPPVILLMGECPGMIPVEQLPMRDAERTEDRAELIKATYWIGAIETGLALGMFAFADTNTARWFTGLAIPVPLISALIVRDTFQAGPGRDEPKKEARSFQIEPAVIAAGTQFAGGMQAVYRF